MGVSNHSISARTICNFMNHLIIFIITPTSLMLLSAPVMTGCFSQIVAPQSDNPPFIPVALHTHTHTRVSDLTATNQLRPS